MNNTFEVRERRNTNSHTASSAGSATKNPAVRRASPFSIFHFLISLLRRSRQVQSARQEVHIIEVLP